MTPQAPPRAGSASSLVVVLVAEEEQAVAAPAAQRWPFPRREAWLSLGPRWGFCDAFILQPNFIWPDIK